MMNYLIRVEKHGTRLHVGSSALSAVPNEYRTKINQKVCYPYLGLQDDCPERLMATIGIYTMLARLCKKFTAYYKIGFSSNSSFLNSSMKWAAVY